MIWFLDYNHRRDAELWNDESDHYLEDVLCPLEPLHRGSRRIWKPAIFREELAQNGKLGSYDLYRSSRASFVLRDPVFEAFEKAGLTGWLRNPASVRSADGTLRHDVGELWVNGFAGIASSRAGCRLLWRCKGCGKTKYSPGLRLDVALAEITQSPADFFIQWPLLNFVFCSDKARDVLLRFDIPEASFKPFTSLTEPIRFYGDAPIPPFYEEAAREQVERYWSSAPLWPDDVEPERGR